jgi:hypothetical protein
LATSSRQAEGPLPPTTPTNRPAGTVVQAAATPCCGDEEKTMSDILKLSRDTDPPAICHAGWDFLTTESGREAEERCRVCGEVMAVARGVVGPTGWAHARAIASGVLEGTPHDEFCCVFSSEAWHRQALALKLEAQKTPSKRVEDLLLEEAEEIVRVRTATKQV